MTTFARINGGTTTDVCRGDSAAGAVGVSFSSGYVNSVGGVGEWKVVPDGTEDNWAVTLDSAGNVVTVTAPAAPQQLPLVLGSTEFDNYTYAVLGAIALPNGTVAQQVAAGIARRGQVLIACRDTNDGPTFEAYTRFMKAGSYDLPAVSGFLEIIGPAGSKITTQAENDAIVNGWKKG